MAYTQQKWERLFVMSLQNSVELSVLKISQINKNTFTRELFILVVCITN